MRLIKSFEGFINNKMCAKWTVWQNADLSYSAFCNKVEHNTGELDMAMYYILSSIREFLINENYKQITIKGYDATP